MKYRKGFIIISLISTLLLQKQVVFSQLIQSNQKYEFARGADHFGLFASLGLNLAGNNVRTDYGNANLKAANALVFLIGPQYQYHFTKTFFIRGSIPIGINGHGYKFKRALKGASDSVWVEFEDKYTRKSISPIVFGPKIELGNQFFIAGKHLVEIAVGGSFEKYLTKNIHQELEKHESKTILSNRDVVTVEVADRKYWGVDKWGCFNGELYIGYRKIGYNDFTNRISWGLNFTYTVDNKSVGYAEVLSYNTKYQYAMGRQVYIMNNMSVSFKLAYDLF